MALYHRGPSWTGCAATRLHAAGTIIDVDASAGGTGDLYWWNASLNGGLGNWALAQSGVSYTINFYDSGNSGKSSSDTFGIQIVYTPVAPQPSVLPDFDGAAA